MTGWRVHAWVLMSNHYHLFLETPEANLIAGMHGSGTLDFTAENAETQRAAENGRRSGERRS